MSTLSRLQTHLRQNAATYFADLAGGNVQVELLRPSHRLNSTLYEFQMSANSVRHAVMVKVPFSEKTAVLARHPRATSDERPRLSAKPPLDWKSHYEFLALSTIERHVQGLEDPRFGAVRILDLLPEYSALVMEKADARSLNRVLLGASRFCRPGQNVAELDAAFHRAGAWLRTFHALRPLPHTQQRNQARDDFVNSIRDFTEYLAGSEDRSYFRVIRRTLTERSLRLLPQQLPLGLCHGDYAPRNVLLDRDGRVCAIDTLGNWQAPIYEDLGRFLCALHASVPQLWLRGWAYNQHTLDRLERQFLAGYFGAAEIPFGLIRAFECQALLDRWAAVVHSGRAARGPRRWAKLLRCGWWRGVFSRHLDRMVQRTTSAPEQHLAETFV
jgi:hypothetical protein